MIAITDDASKKIFYGLGGSFSKVWNDAQCPAGTKLARFKLIQIEMPKFQQNKSLLIFLKKRQVGRGRGRVVEDRPGGGRE